MVFIVSYSFPGKVLEILSSLYECKNYFTARAIAKLAEYYGAKGVVIYKVKEKVCEKRVEKENI